MLYVERSHTGFMRRKPSHTYSPERVLKMAMPHPQQQPVKKISRISTIIAGHEDIYNKQCTWTRAAVAWESLAHV